MVALPAAGFVLLALAGCKLIPSLVREGTKSIEHKRNTIEILESDGVAPSGAVTGPSSANFGKTLEVWYRDDGGTVVLVTRSAGKVSLHVDVNHNGKEDDGTDIIYGATEDSSVRARYCHPPGTPPAWGEFRTSARVEMRRFSAGWEATWRLPKRELDPAGRTADLCFEVFSERDRKSEYFPGIPFEATARLKPRNPAPGPPVTTENNKARTRLLVAIDVSMPIGTRALEIGRDLIKDLPDSFWTSPSGQTLTQDLQVIAFAGGSSPSQPEGQDAAVSILERCGRNKDKIVSDLEQIIDEYGKRRASLRCDGGDSEGRLDALGAECNVCRTDFRALFTAVTKFVTVPQSQPTHNVVWIVSDGWHDPRNQNEPTYPPLPALQYKDASIMNPVINDLVLVYVDPRLPARWNEDKAKKLWTEGLEKLAGNGEPQKAVLGKFNFTLEPHSTSRRHLERQLIHRMLGLADTPGSGLINFGNPTFSCMPDSDAQGTRIETQSDVHTSYSKPVRVSYRYWYPFQGGLVELRKPSKTNRGQLLPVQVSRDREQVSGKWTVVPSLEPMPILYAVHTVQSDEKLDGLPLCWQERRLVSLARRFAPNSQVDVRLNRIAGLVSWFRPPSAQDPLIMEIEPRWIEPTRKSDSGPAALVYYRDGSASGGFTGSCRAADPKLGKQTNDGQTGSISGVKSGENVVEQLPTSAGGARSIIGPAVCRFWMSDPSWTDYLRPGVYSCPLVLATGGPDGREVAREKWWFGLFGWLGLVIWLAHSVTWIGFCIYVYVKRFDKNVDFDSPFGRAYRWTFMCWLLMAASVALVTAIYFLRQGRQPAIAFLWRDLEAVWWGYVALICLSGILLALLAPKIVNARVTSVFRVGCYVMIGTLFSWPTGLLCFFTFNLARDFMDEEWKRACKGLKIVKILGDIVMPRLGQ
jgi:hypothetical protein